MTLGLLITFLGLYLGLALFLLVYYAPSKTTAQTNWQPTVSIIVAARNEAHTLPACLRSLVELDYPTDKLEILVINDHSQDLSGQVIESFAPRHNHLHPHVLMPEDKALPGKAGAVLAGIERSRGEIIFLTDADCQVPRTWVRSLLDEFTPATGLVGGFTLLHNKNHSSSLMGKIQSLDWLFLLTIAATAARLGKPLSWMGNNLAFRRTAYDEVGGYRALGESLIEDFVLIHALSRRTSWRISFQCQPESTIYSQPILSLRALYQQRKRWGLGIRLVRPFGKVLMASSFITHLFVLASFFVSPLAAIWSMGALLGVDLLICWRGAIRLRRRDLLRYFAGFQLFYFAYTILLPFALLFSSQVAWKNQIYPTRPRPSGPGKKINPANG